jgi:DNA adenine methylase
MRNMAPFRYWGAKVRMAPWIIDRIPAHEHFIESCAGSAAVIAAKPPSMFETVNDVYGEVVNFFRVLRDRDLAAELIDLVAFTPYAHAEFIAAANPSSSPLERALAFFVRMQMAVVPGRTGWSYSVGGASAKKANKPGRWATMPEHLKTICRRFDRVQVTDWPIIELLQRFDKPGILHFVDPPYLNESRPTSVGKSSGYVCDTFDHAAFVKAAQAAVHADILVTHYPHPMFDDGPWENLGDYESHRNIPNSETDDEGRAVAVERLYRLRRAS